MKHYVPLLLVVPALLSPIASAIAADADTSVGHKAVAYFVPEKRIRVEAKVKDPKGVNLVRAYFKSDAHADYLFVPLAKLETDPNSYAGCLPAPAASTASMEYLFLVVNGERKVVKTAPPQKAAARTDKDVPSWQMGCGNDQLTLYKELPEIPSPTGAYSDSVAMDVVESSARYGVIAGLFGGESSAAAVAASGASNAGTVAVAGAGITATSVIAALAVTGGIASSGGGSSGTTDTGGTGGTGDTGGTGGTGGTTNPYAGTWSGIYHPDFCQVGFHVPWFGTVYPDGVFNASLGDWIESTGTCAVSGQGGTVTGTVDANTGAMSGSSTAGCNYTGGFTLTPTRDGSGTYSCIDQEFGTWRTGT